MAKLEHARSTGYERKVRAYLDSQGMAKLNTKGRQSGTQGSCLS